MKRDGDISNTVIIKAVDDPEAFYQVREFVLPTVREFVTKIRGQNRSCGHSSEELIEIGVSALKKALDVYIKNGHHEEHDPEYFRKYFLWWARQEIFHHIESCKK